AAPGARQPPEGLVHRGLISVEHQAPANLLRLAGHLAHFRPILSTCSRTRKLPSISSGLRQSKRHGSVIAKKGLISKSVTSVSVTLPFERTPTNTSKTTSSRWLYVWKTGKKRS